MKTLIIVDPQYDFMPGGSLEIAEGDQIVKPINAIQDKFDLVVATQDWHPPQHWSFASNHEGKKPLEKTTLSTGMEQILWPDHCVQGSGGAEFHEDLDTHRVEAIFRKGMNIKMDSYSGFYDNGHEKSTGLTGYLREKGVKGIHFCGLAADICVYFTIKDALKEGFRAKLLTDATRPLDPAEFDKIKQELADEGVEFVRSGDL